MRPIYKYFIIFDMTYERTLTALADGRRREILALLRVRPRDVTELTKRLGVSQPAVSQHLRTLRETELVRVEPDGTRRIYHLDLAGLEPLRDYVASFWDEALEAFRSSFPANQELEDPR